MAGFKTQQEFLDLAERVVDADWLANLRDIGPGYELIRAKAAMAARGSLAVSRADDCLFIASAPSGGYATVPARFRRQSAMAGALTIKAGSIVSTPSNRRFLLQEDVALGALDTVSDFATVRAEFQGYEWNVLGQQTAADGSTIPGEISVPTMILTDPAAVDLSIQVENVDAATGGAPRILAEHGRDRGLPMFPGEQTEPYRERIRSIPLAITKPNILQAVNAVLAPYGVEATMVECFEADKFGCLDWPADQPFPPFVPDGQGLALIDGVNTVVAELYPRHAAGKWLDCVTAFSSFFLELPPIQPVEDFGLLLDDPMVGVGDLVSPQSGGRRCVSAYDMDNTMAATDVLLPALGGFDAPRLALLNGLEALLHLIKMGNVVAVIVMRGGVS